jgi:hypothetical protein
MEVEEIIALFWCINHYEIRNILAKPVAVIVSSG